LSQGLPLTGPADPQAENVVPSRQKSSWFKLFPVIGHMKRSDALELGFIIPLMYGSSAIAQQFSSWSSGSLLRPYHKIVIMVVHKELKSKAPFVQIRLTSNPVCLFPCLA
jgi:hypothetical protein